MKKIFKERLILTIYIKHQHINKTSRTIIYNVLYVKIV